MDGELSVMQFPKHSAVVCEDNRFRQIQIIRTLEQVWPICGVHLQPND